MSDKYREFWIKDFIAFKTDTIFSDGANIREAYDKPAPTRQIHVIEKRAYDDLLEKMIVCDRKNLMMFKENIKLLFAINAIQNHIRRLQDIKIIGNDDMNEALKVIIDNLKENENDYKKFFDYINSLRNNTSDGSSPCS